MYLLIEGIFFIAADVQTGVLLLDPNSSYRVEVVGKNTSSELMFTVPNDPPPGSYRLEVRTLPAAGEVRTGALKTRLTVG